MWPFTRHKLPAERFVEIHHYAAEGPSLYNGVFLEGDRIGEVAYFASNYGGTIYYARNIYGETKDFDTMTELIRWLQESQE